MANLEIFLFLCITKIVFDIQSTAVSKGYKKFMRLQKNNILRSTRYTYSGRQQYISDWSVQPKNVSNGNQINEEVNLFTILMNNFWLLFLYMNF